MRIGIFTWVMLVVVHSSVAAAPSHSTSPHSAALDSATRSQEEGAVHSQQQWAPSSEHSKDTPTKTPSPVESQRLRGGARSELPSEEPEKAKTAPQETPAPSEMPPKTLDARQSPPLQSASQQTHASSEPSLPAVDSTDGEDALQGVCVFLLCWICVGLASYAVLSRRRRKHERERYRRLATIFS